MTDFDIRGLLRQIIIEHDSIDAAEVALKAASQVPEAEVRDVLGLALRDLARNVLAEFRPRGHIPPSRLPLPTPAPASQQRVRHFPPSERRAATVGGRKGAEIRDAWQKVLDTVYTTADGPKKLGDFTYADCHYLARVLDKQAEDKQARARLFRAIAAQFNGHATMRIRDLPAEVKMQLLGGRP